MYVVSLGFRPRKSEWMYKLVESKLVFSAVRSVKGFLDSPNVLRRSVVGILLSDNSNSAPTALKLLALYVMPDARLIAFGNKTEVYKEATNFKVLTRCKPLSRDNSLRTISRKHHTSIFVIY